MGYDLHLQKGEYVYTHARAFTQHPDFDLVAAVDPDKLKGETFQQKYGCSAYADLSVALQSKSPDVVVIATPTNLHLEVLSNVLKKTKPKLILCEKPLAYKLSDAEKMLTLCSEAGVQLLVNYMRRSDPGVAEVKRLFDSSVPTAKGVVWYSKGFLHNGSHFFNLIEHWMGAAKSHQVIKKGRAIDDADGEVDVAVQFEKGLVTFLSAWEEAFSHYTIELVSPAGRLRYDNGGESIEWRAVETNNLVTGYSRLATTPLNIISGMDRYQWHVADEISNFLANRESRVCTGAEALATLSSMSSILSGAV